MGISMFYVWNTYSWLHIWKVWALQCSRKTHYFLNGPYCLDNWQMETVSCFLSGFLCRSLSEERIKEYISGSQNFWKVSLMVACCNAMGIKVSSIGGDIYSFTGLVHEEKGANCWYTVHATLSPLSIDHTECVCAASLNLHNKCKHIAALLLSLYLLQSVPQSTPKKSFPNG